MRTVQPSKREPERNSIAYLRDWVNGKLALDPNRASELLSRVDEVVQRQRQLVEASKQEAIRALSEGFAEKMERLQRQLADKDTTVSNIARYFEEIVADLSDKSHRDPKTKLLNFDWFMERLESFLAVEQRTRWSGLGVVDINSFKWYNDTLGHAIGDKVIEGVARILADQIRSQDVLASDREIEGRDLHARFGGDEFCFLIPDLPGAGQAVDIAARFKHAVESLRLVARGRPPRVTPGARRRRRRLPPARTGPRAARRGAQTRRRADSARRQVDVRRQGDQVGPRPHHVGSRGRQPDHRHGTPVRLHRQLTAALGRDKLESFHPMVGVAQR